MVRALIFGIGGFVRPYLAQEFMDHGYKVYGCDIQVNDKLQPEVDFYRVDFLEEESVRYILRKIAPDVVVNLAAISSVGLSWKIPQSTMISLGTQKITVEVDSERFRPIDTPRVCCDYHMIERELG